MRVRHAIKPFRLYLRTQPFRRDAGKIVECRAPRLSNTFEPIEGTDSRKHMRRVGSLFASCFQQSLFFEPLQHGFEQNHLS